MKIKEDKLNLVKRTSTILATSALTLAIAACSSSSTEPSGIGSANDSDDLPAITATTTNPMRAEIAYEGKESELELDSMNDESASLEDNDFVPSWSSSVDTAMSSESTADSSLQGDMRVFFAFDSAQPASGTISSAVSEVKEALRRSAAAGTLESVRIVGHTDSFGPSDYNLMLSKQRAENVRDMLQRELPNVDMSLVRIEIEAKGEQDLIEYGSTPEQQAMNRRVEVFLATDESLASR